MDFFQWMLLIVGIAGVIFIIFSLVFSGGEKEDDEITEYDGTLVEYLNRNKIRDVDSSLLEADQTISELDGMSKSIFKELDNKYDELLFLYNLIDEKKKEIDSALPNNTTLNNVKPIKASSGKSKQLDIVINDKTSKSYNNNHLSDIIKLRESGLSTAEIAKTLSLGQNEVALIIELYERSNRRRGG